MHTIDELTCRAYVVPFVRGVLHACKAATSTEGSCCLLTGALSHLTTCEVHDDAMCKNSIGVQLPIGPSSN
jgi:hypothetical protein